MRAKAHYLGFLGNCQSETPTKWHCGVGSEHDDNDDDDHDDHDDHHHHYHHVLLHLTWTC